MNVNLWVAVACVTLAGCPSRRLVTPEREGFFVAVGSAGTIITSPDGATWTAATSGSGESLLGVAAGGGRVVAVGAGGEILVSDDGTTWSAATTPTTADLSDVIHDGTRFVAVGGDWQLGAVTVVSDDGMTWSKLPSPKIYAFTDVAAGDSALVALGWYLSDLQTSALFTSDGGRDGWSKRFEADGPGVTYNDVARSDDGVWVVAGSAFVLVSDNSTAWSRHDLPDDATAGLRCVIHDGTRFVAVGEAFTGAIRGAVLVSVDGKAWSQAALIEGIAPEAMAAGEGTLVAVGTYGAILSSVDAVTWTTVPAPTSEHLTAITWIEGS